METISFAFGVLSMVGLLLVILIVIGAVKVIKQAKQIQELERQILDNDNELHRRISHAGEYTARSFDAVNDQITDSVTQCNSYTDKRIDKLIDTYFMVKESKQILNENKQK